MMRAACILLLAALAEPPVPPTPTQVTLAWDANDPREEVAGYFLHQATNVTGPWEIVGMTTNTNAVVTLPHRGRWFWYVTASNMWGMSEPSNTVNTPEPASRVNGTTVKR